MVRQTEGRLVAHHKEQAVLVARIKAGRRVPERQRTITVALRCALVASTERDEAVHAAAMAARAASADALTEWVTAPGLLGAAEMFRELESVAKRAVRLASANGEASKAHDGAGPGDVA